jgi:hypothetical protein
MSNPTKKTVVIGSKTDILKQIGAIGKAAVRVTAAIQNCAVQCAIHAVRHGDVTLADELVEALGKGMRKASLRAWFETQTPMIIAKGKDKFSLDKERAKELRERDDEALVKLFNTVAWEEAKPEEKVVSVIDVAESFDKFMARIDKMVKESGVTVKHRDMLDALRGLSAEYHSKMAAEPAAS